MLQELRSNLSPGVLLITDTAFHNGRELLLSFVVAALQREELVHVFGYEVPQEDFYAAIPPALTSRLTFHDGFSDPLHWNNTQLSLTLQDFTFDQIWGRVGNATRPVTLVLDSLSWLLARCPIPSICHTLQDLARRQKGTGSTVTRVLALLHTDLHAPGVLHSVTLLADTVINVTERGEHDRVTVVHRKKTGKIITTREEVKIQDGFNLEIFKEQVTEQKKTVEVEAKMNLTFNPHLSESERGLKESATLPYTFSASKKSSLLQSSTGSAKIYYDPDPADDFDDEDPDDDLDV
ncbi:elongator complex protein 5 [Discoglossus pictus]